MQPQFISQKPVLFPLLLFMVIMPCSSFKKKQQAEPEGFAVIIAVPQVDNVSLHKKKLLSQNKIFNPLEATVMDGNLFENILLRQGFKKENIIRVGVNKSDRVKVSDIKNAIEKIGDKIKATGVNNNLFVLYYSGHGYQVDDTNGDESDHKDEVLVGNDGYLVDDDIAGYYKTLFKTTRNIMLADACHAGSLFMFQKLSNNNEIHERACNISSENYADAGMNIIYMGSSLDENESFDKNGGFFTRALYSLSNKTAMWRSLKPREAACQLSLTMQGDGDPEKGRIQYTETGKLPDTFLNNYLFKIK